MEQDTGKDGEKYHLYSVSVIGSYGENKASLVLAESLTQAEEFIQCQIGSSSRVGKGRTIEHSLDIPSTSGITLLLGPLINCFKRVP